MVVALLLALVIVCVVCAMCLIALNTLYSPNNYFTLSHPCASCVYILKLRKPWTHHVKSRKACHLDSANANGANAICRRLALANVTDNKLGTDQEHWYYRLIGCGDMGCGDRGKYSSEYLIDELPFFQLKRSLYLYCQSKSAEIFNLK